MSESKIWVGRFSGREGGRFRRLGDVNRHRFGGEFRGLQGLALDDEAGQGEGVANLLA